MFPPTPAQIFTRSLALTYNPNRRRAKSTATATPAVADAAQSDRDFFWSELLRESRSGKYLRPTWIAWMLHESGRSESDLDAALADAEQAAIAANPVMSTPATSPTAKVTSPVTKESPMSAAEKIKVKKEWDAAMQAMYAAHPRWNQAQCLSAVVRENPTLHQRYIAAANSR